MKKGAAYMNTYDEVLKYLVTAYNPDAIIVYGSFADGSANENSDFDALVIAGSPQKHDDSIVGNTVLDVFIYPPEVFQSKYDPEEFVQVHDGKVVLDKDGIAEALKTRVNQYIAQLPTKTTEEVQQEISWCKKMLARTSRGDAEGYYRWHWLLCDSLEIYYDAKGLYYFGPKKSLRTMAEFDKEAFQLYSLALKKFDQEALFRWISYLESQI